MWNVCLDLIVGRLFRSSQILSHQRGRTFDFPVFFFLCSPTEALMGFLIRLYNAECNGITTNGGGVTQGQPCAGGVG